MSKENVCLPPMHGILLSGMVKHYCQLDGGEAPKAYTTLFN